MNLPSVGTAVVSTAGFLSNAIGALKNAREIAKDSSDTALKEQINAAYDALLDLREHALNRDEEIRQLKAQLAQKAAYTGPVAPHGYYYAADDAQAKQHPICPSCFQLRQVIAFMSDENTGNGGAERFCLICKEYIHEKVPDRSPAMAVVDYDPYKRPRLR